MRLVFISLIIGIFITTLFYGRLMLNYLVQRDVKAKRLFHGSYFLFLAEFAILISLDLHFNNAQLLNQLMYTTNIVSPVSIISYLLGGCLVVALLSHALIDIENLQKSTRV